MSEPKEPIPKETGGIAGGMAAMFIESKLTPLFIIASTLLGTAAVILLPREEEPQIIVPMIDVMVSMPGAGAQEVAERVTRPMEKLLWEIPDVEYLYSMSRPGESLVIVRFKVGTNVERALVLLNQKLQMNFDRIPHGVSTPLIKPRSIDDVPILALTFHSSRYDHQTLRAIAAQVDDRIKGAANVAETRILGGAERAVRVQLDPAALAARGLTAAGLVPMIQQANRQSTAGGMLSNNREIVIETGGFLETAEDVANIVVGVAGGRPVYLRDVAQIIDGAARPANYVFFTEGVGSKNGASEIEAAATLTVAKRPGANAITVAHDVLARVESLRGTVLPEDVKVTITRHYGETASEKSNELLLHMAIAIVSVSLLIWFALGWRESLIVAVAIPTTLALTLLVFYLYGYTLNRITLFALIFSIGILVDDAIVVVENIVRHMHLPENKGRSLPRVAVEAVAEVGNPTILATLAVIAAILPMAFVGGLMGPYMRPIPIGATAAMAWSLLVAFTVTPWAARRILKKEALATTKHAHNKEDFFTRLYRRVMAPLIHHPLWQLLFLLGCALLLFGSIALVGIGWVKVKMLPFDNKSEFQVILNMPEGSSLENTVRVAKEMADVLRKEPEVTDIQIYAGTSAPFNFNGLVRHYFLRAGDHVADLQVNLLPKHERAEVSHDIAKRVRPALASIAERNHARLAIAEVPPGPPVLQTIVAEVYAPTPADRQKLAEAVKDIFKQTPGVVDIDSYVEADQPEARFVVDKEKAALSGISAESVARTLAIAVDGLSVDLLHDARAKEDVNIVLEIPERYISSPEDLLSLRVRPGDANALLEPTAGAAGADTLNAPALVPLREIVSIEHRVRDKTIHRKNLLNVTYVIGDVAGVIESPVYAILHMNEKIRELNGAQFGGAAGSRVEIYNATMPANDDAPAIKWDGEWHITLEVFRDLGTAFAAVLVLIYLLMVGWFKSFFTPLIVMAAIPFSLVGILPAHGTLGAFFTATSMIGFMAGAGIVVRNSIILVDFIEQRLREGMPLAEAVVDAGAVRFRPMLLTAMAVVVGASVILFDPIFQGLAISLMAGEIASLLLSRLAVPVLYYVTNKQR